MVFNNNLLLGAAGAGGGYSIDQSIRFNSNDTPVLSRTFGTPTDQNKFTYAFWIKSTKQKNGYNFETNTTGGVTFSGMVFNGGNMAFYDYSGGSAQIDVRTTFTSGVGKFRDYSAWYHAMFVYDSDQSTDSDRLKFYINGTQFPVDDLVGPSGGSVIWPGSGANSKFNASGTVHRISSSVNGLVDGYMAEIYFLDGVAATPSDFGEFDADSNQFVPIEYSGSFGNNGFYITGADSANLGADNSGNGNDFTSSGLTAADQVTDSPTDNYATLNSLLKHSSVTLADGNLEASTGTNGWFGSVGTIGIQLGDKVYFEGKCLTNTRLYFGLSRINGTGGSINPLNSGTFEGNRSDTDYMWRVTSADTVYYQTTNQSVTVSAVAVNDIVGCSVDTDGTVKFYKNGTEIHSFSTKLIAGDTYMPVYSVNGATSTEKWEVRFGSTGISHQPAGFSLLRTSQMDDPTIALPEKYFNTVLYEGNGGGQRVGQFQPITETYTVPNSVIFNDDDSAFLYRTPSSTSNRKTYTVSLWFKIGDVGKEPTFFMAGDYPGGSSPLFTGFNLTNAAAASPTLQFAEYPGGASYTWQVATNRIFKDPSKWYHLVGAVDTTQSTASDRVKLYVDGVLQTSLRVSSYPSLNHDTHINSNSYVHRIGRYGTTGFYADGYMADFYFIDGQALGPDSFGQLDASTNKWIPKDASGLTFGTNGFYLDMETAPGTGSGAGTDSSGNSNNFTESGLAASDQVTDSPTENFCVLNPNDEGTQVTLSNGNLQYGLSSNSYTAVRGTFGVSSGKWYWEMNAVSGMGVNTAYIGIATKASNLQTSSAPTDGTAYVYISYTGNKAHRSNTSYGDTWNTNGRVIGVALDLDEGKIWWSRDGVWQDSGDPAAGTNEAFSGITGTWYPYIVFNDTSPNFLFDFGQSGFTYTPPTGFNAINNDNLPLSNGDLSAFVWIKNRDATDNHMVFNAVRGPNIDQHTNSTDGENTNPNTLTRFLKNGFEVSTDAEVNTSGESYVAWQWLTDSLTISANGDGSTSTSVIANTTSGFSIATYPGTGANATVGHGLGVAPSFVLVKAINDSHDWYVWTPALATTEFLKLNTTAAKGTASPEVWNSTAPTSSVVSLGTSIGVNRSGYSYVMYCFAEVDGFSKVSSYTGNGSTDGPFVYTGFKPSWIMLKRTGAAQEWQIYDAARDPYNLANHKLEPNSTSVESVLTTDNNLDFLSNGFKLLQSNGGMNASGNEYIYMAFAECPFKTANARGITTNDA